MQPKNPDPSYDFILKNTPKPKRTLFPAGNRLVLILGTAVVLLVLIFIIGAVVNKGGGKTSQLVDVVARAQEISRVSKAQLSNLKDPSIINLAATSETVIASQQAQLNKYLADHHAKVDKKKLAAYESKTTDTQLSAAAQSNNLDLVYTNYLRAALSSYAQSVKNAYSATKNAKAKTILQDAYNSTSVLLTTAPLKS